MSTDAPPSGMRVIKIEPGFAMAEVERCMLTVWRHQPTSDAFNLRHGELQDLARRHPKQCGYLEVIEPTSTPPTNELRKVAVDVFRKLGEDLCCVGFVLDGPQLRTALVRAILTTMTFLVPQLQPSKVFKRVGDGVEWMKSRTGSTSPEFDARIQAAFEYLRRQPST